MQVGLHKQGFTIVELLIVIVVIAILAAITIVSFNGIQNRARTSAVQAELRTAATKLEVNKQQNGTGVYANSLQNAGIASDTVSFQYSLTDGGRSYCLIGSLQSARYSITNTAGSLSEGGCSITNLVENPNLEANSNGWVTSSTSDASLDRVQVNGNWVASSTRNSTNAVAIRLSGIPIPVTVGETYTVSATVTSTIAQPVRIDMRRHPNTSTMFTQTQNFSAGESLRLSATGVADTDTAQIAFFLPAGSYAGGTLTFDNVMLTQGDQLYGYADGNTQGWQWLGVQNGSRSSGPALP